MAGTQQNQTPRNALSGLFGPKFLDDPEALSGIASSLGMGAGTAPGNTSTSDPNAPPDASGAANSPIPGPMTGVVPKSFNEWAADPVNLAKIPRQINNSPLPGTNPSIPPLIARPPDDSTPSAAPIAPQGQEIAPRGIASGAQASPAATSGASLEDSLFKPDAAAAATPSVFPNRTDWLAQNPNAAAIPAPPHKYGTRGSFAMALATLGDTMGAALTGGKPIVGPHWLEQVQAGQEYQRNLPVMTQQAQTAAYEKAQGEAGESAKIAGSQASTAHLQAETQALLGGGPFYEQAGKVRQEIQQMWQQGNLAPADFDKAVALKMQGLAPNVQRLIPVDFGQQVKGLPQTPPKFTAGASGIEPITYRGQNYGVTPVQGEPAEVTQARQTALDAQKQNETSKQALKEGEFPPIVVARLGKPPLGDPVAMQAYGKKAQDIMTAISSAPRLSMIDARPMPVAEVDAQGNPTGKIIYERSKQAIDSGAMAPGSVPFQAQKKVVESATSGPIGAQITAFNTAIQHADLLRQAAKAMNNGDTRTLNSLKNTLSSQFGDPDLTNFEAIANTYNHEITSVVSKGHMTDAEVKSGAGTMPSNANYETIDKVLGSYQALAQSKMNQLQQQVEKGKKGQANFPEQPSGRGLFGGGASGSQSAPAGASDEVYAADGKTLIGHIVKGSYVPLGK